MSKPDWKDAPKWAKWVSQDTDGGWWWYECKPTWYVSDWFSSVGNYESVSYVSTPVSTLEKRQCLAPLKK